jgi:hypothetical protein
LRLLDLLLGATTGQLYQRPTLAGLADPSAELAVEAILVGFTDEERCPPARRNAPLRTTDPAEAHTHAESASA